MAPRTAVVLVAVLFACPLAGAQDTALYFNGVSDFVTIPDATGDLDVTTAFTIEMWAFHSTQTASWQPLAFGLMDGGGGSWLMNVIEGQCGFSVSTPGTDAVFSDPGYPCLPVERWQHLAGTYDGQVLALYIDGWLIASQLHSTQGPVAPVSQVALGAWPGGGYYFTGVLDEVAMWSTVRTPEQIRTDRAGLSGTEPGLVGYWKLDDATGQLVSDSGPDANHGWLGADATAAGDDPDWVLSHGPLFLDGFESGVTSAWGALP